MTDETPEQWAARVGPTVNWQDFDTVFFVGSELGQEDALESMEALGLIRVHRDRISCNGSWCWGTKDMRKVDALIDWREAQ